MATAEVKLGGSQLLVKHTTKLWLRDEKETNAAPYKQNWFLLPMEVQGKGLPDYTSGRKKASPAGKSGKRVERAGDE